MPNANWSNPTLTSTYTNFVAEVKNRDEDLALQFDGTTSTNIPTNTIRWDSSAGRWKKWNGTAWAELTSLYALTGLSTTGNASIGGTFGVTGAATFSSTLGVTGALTGSSTISGTALVPTAATIPSNGVYLPGANTVGIATGGVAAALVDDNGDLSVYNAAGTFSHRFANQPTANRTVTLPDANVTLVAGTMAPVDSPTLTGTPAAPTAAAGTNTTQIATTAFVSTAISNAVAKVPQNAQSSAYTLVAADAGKHVSITTGGVTVPASVFATGDVISIYNNSASTQTISQGASVTLRQSGTTNTGNRSLGAYGVATLLCVGANTFSISGAGVS